MNKYLQEKMMRRDGRGTGRGMHRRESRRERDRSNDYGYNYARDDGRGYSERSSDYRGGDYHYGYGYPNEYPRRMEYEPSGHGTNDFEEMSEHEKEWKEDLKEWCHELKHYDKFGLNKEQLIQMAKQIGVKFEYYDEDELITTYYMILSDFDGPLISSPQNALTFAKKWLEDVDTKFKGSDKLCAYYYEVVKGGE